MSTRRNLFHATGPFCMPSNGCCPSWCSTPATAMRRRMFPELFASAADLKFLHHCRNSPVGRRHGAFDLPLSFSCYDRSLQMVTWVVLPAESHAHRLGRS